MKKKRNSKKLGKVFAMVVAASLTVSVLQVSVFAADKNTITSTVVSSEKATVWDGKSPMEAGKNYIITGNVKLSKNFTIPKGATLKVSDGASLTVKKNIKLIVSGELNVSKKAALSVSGNFVMQKSGTANISGELKATTSAVLDIKGAVKTAKGSSTTISGALNVFPNASVEVAGKYSQTQSSKTKVTGSFKALETSDVKFNGTFAITNSGSSVLDGKVTTNKSSNLKINGTLTFSKHSKVKIAGEMTIGKAAELTVDGSLTATETAEIDVMGEIHIESTDVTIDGTLSINKTAVLDGDGTINGDGTIITDKGADVQVEINIETANPNGETPSTPTTPSTPYPSVPSGGGSYSDFYTVTFNANGGISGTKTSQNIAKRGYVTLPTSDEAPTRVDHTFAGWNTRADGSGIMFDGSDAINESITVYAQWISSISITPTAYISAGDITNKSSNFASKYYNTNINTGYDNDWYFDIAGSFTQNYINSIVEVKLNNTPISNSTFQLSVGNSRFFPVKLYDFSTDRFRIALNLIALENPVDGKLVFNIRATGYDTLTVTVNVPSMTPISANNLTLNTTGVGTVDEFDVTWNNTLNTASWQHMLKINFGITDPNTIYFTKKVVTKNGGIVSTSYGFTKAEPDGTLGFYPTIYDNESSVVTYSVATAHQYGVAVTNITIGPKVTSEPTP